MAKYYLRIITDLCTQDTEAEILSFLRENAGCGELQAGSIMPYRKNPGQGELNCSFTSALPMAEIQALLADRWEGDVADSRWSCIHVPHAFFLWLTF